MTKYYYFENNNWVGLFEENEIKNFLSKGLINKHTLVKGENEEEGRTLDIVFSWASAEWSEDMPHPWRRWFARACDSGFSYIISLLIITFLTNDENAHLLLEDTSPLTIYSTLFYLLLSFFLPAFLICLTGKSIGKWLFGIQILNDDGSTLGFAKSLHREWMVTWRGLGLNIPIISMYANYKGYRTLTGDGITSWDKDLNIKVLYRKSGIKQRLLYVLALITQIPVLLLLV